MPITDTLELKKELFSVYHEYLSNFYPSDPNIYVIRAHPETVYDLERRQNDYQVDIEGYPWVNDGEPRFLTFRLKSDVRLPPGEIIFGPETVDIKWSK
jgi:hypothetical protein